MGRYTGKVGLKKKKQWELSPAHKQILNKSQQQFEKAVGAYNENLEKIPRYPVLIDGLKQVTSDYNITISKMTKALIKKSEILLKIKNEN